MAKRGFRLAPGGYISQFLILGVALIGVALMASGAKAAPYAAVVMDARNGNIYYETNNANTPLHPASLTKMMTLYIAFEAIKNGEITLDTPVTISRYASRMEPSKLGMRVGEKIKLRYLIRAAAVKSANDAAAAIGEAIEGNQTAFAARMNRTAKALGMTHSHFVNMNGLTAKGHLSTAHDMAVLGRHLLFDYPQYYNLFSRISTNAGGKTVYNTNRKLLRSYPGADGIKTGWTTASGSNLVASAKHGNVRIIVAVFGGRTSAWRNERVKELLNKGFAMAPKNVRTIPPALPDYGDPGGTLLMAGVERNHVLTVSKSLRPQERPAPAQSDTPDVVMAAMNGDTDDNALNDKAIAMALASATKPVAPPVVATGPADHDTGSDIAPVVTRLQPVARPSDLLAQFPDKGIAPPKVETKVEARVEDKPATPTEAVATDAVASAAQTNAVTQISAGDGAPLWSVNVGRFPSRISADKAMLATAMSEVETLAGAKREVNRGATGFDAIFSGLTRDAADRTCQRLNARKHTCFMIGPDT